MEGTVTLVNALSDTESDRLFRRITLKIIPFLFIPNSAKYGL